MITRAQAWFRPCWRSALPLLLVLLCGAVPAVAAESVSAAQRRAAAEFLAAVASGSAQAVAYAIHPSELDRLRVSITLRLREEAARGDGTLRARLFGPAVPLADVERMTSLAFYQALGRRLVLPAREYEDVKGLAAVREGEGVVHVLVKGRQPKDRTRPDAGERSEVVEVVTLLPYGKEWKAAIPGEIEAQVEDLLAGRTGPRAAGPVAGTGSATAGPGGAGPVGATPAPGAPPAAANSPEILSLLGGAEKALVDGRCDEYYKQYLSPSLRRSLSGRALDQLIAGCRNSIANRELLIAALRIVRRLPPRYDFGGSRATYDVSGQGLPYDRYVLEQVEGRWYIAE
jgi:hypothetical protein